MHAGARQVVMPSCRRFEGKVALVTAATAGIGFGIAQRLGEEGAKLVICSRKQNNVDDSLKTLQDKGIECVGCVCHVGNRQHVEQFVKLALDTYGQIDVLVSNAAVNPASGPLLSIPESAIDKTLEINIKAAIMLVKATAPHLKRGASVVFISSYTAFNPSEPLAIYAVSKTAVVGLTKALAVELGPSGIRVNCVAPGDFASSYCIFATISLHSHHCLLNMMPGCSNDSRITRAIVRLSHVEHHAVNILSPYFNSGAMFVSAVCPAASKRQLLPSHASILALQALCRPSSPLHWWRMTS